MSSPVLVVSKKAVSCWVTEEKTLVLRAAVILWPLNWEGRTLHLRWGTGQHPPSSGRSCRSYRGPPAGRLQSDPSIPGQVSVKFGEGAKDGGMGMGDGGWLTFCSLSLMVAL